MRVLATLAAIVVLGSGTPSFAAPAASQHPVYWPEGVKRIPDPIVRATRTFAKNPTKANLTRLYKTFAQHRPKTPSPVRGPGAFLSLLERKPRFERFLHEFKELQHTDGDLAVALGKFRTLGGESVTGSVAGVFGWDGDRHAAIAHPAGFDVVLPDGKSTKTMSFGIFKDPKSFKWFNRLGYLPSLITDFEADEAAVRIENFADKVKLDGKGHFVVAYSRVSITNKGKTARTMSPKASPEMIAFGEREATIAPGATRHFDFATVLDRYGRVTGWPAADEVKALGGFDRHLATMQTYWDTKLSEIADIHTPDRDLNNAYRAGFIYTHIVKDGGKTNVGENGYDRVWDHDAIGILGGLLSVGNMRGARQLLRNLPTGFEFADATYKYSWPWALYLLKTGDKAFVKRNLKKIKETAHEIGTSRTGPGGIMKPSFAIDQTGYWTVDNWSALFGLKSYEFIARELGDQAEADWARAEYKSLHGSVARQLRKVIKRHELDYIPASMTEPNEMNRTGRPDDANWAAHLLFGRWAWDGWLAGAHQNGAGLDMIDETYDWGFERLSRAGLPRGTFGGFPGYSSAYNAGYGAAALRGTKHRDAGIKAAQFMIEKAQSGPWSWWEGISAPRKSPWAGTHPAGGTGSSPHMWGQSVFTKVVLDSLAAEFYDGRVIVGRGVPTEWLKPLVPIQVSNFPISGSKHLNVTITPMDQMQIRLDLTGDRPSGSVMFSLPVFVNNIAAVSHGKVNLEDGTVTFPSSVRRVTVTLANPLSTGGSH
jgi:hypothetical protein